MRAKTDKRRGYYPVDHKPILTYELNVDKVRRASLETFLFVCHFMKEYPRENGVPKAPPDSKRAFFTFMRPILQKTFSPASVQEFKDIFTWYQSSYKDMLDYHNGRPVQILHGETDSHCEECADAIAYVMGLADKAALY